MRPLLFLIAPLFLLTYCKTSSEKKDSVGTFLAKLSFKDSVRRTFLPIIVGEWVPVDYIENIQRTRSAYKAHVMNNGDDGIYVNPANLEDTLKDSVNIVFTYGAAGPAQCFLPYKKGKNPNSLCMYAAYLFDSNYVELGYNMDQTDTTLILYKYNLSGKKLLSKREYKRAPLKLSSNGIYPMDALDFFLDKLIFSGTYLYKDSLGKQNQVKFDNYGYVQGLPGFNHYIIEQDYGQGPGVDTDIITSNAGDKRNILYIFNYSSDTLRLFDYYFNDSIGKYEDVKLKYKLIRQK